MQPTATKYMLQKAIFKILKKTKNFPLSS